MSAFDTLRDLLNSRYESIRGFLVPHLIRLIDSANNQGDETLIPGIQGLISDLSNFRLSTVEAVEAYSRANPTLPFVVLELQAVLPPRIEMPAIGVVIGGWQLAHRVPEVPDEFAAQAPSAIPREDMENNQQ